MAAPKLKSEADKEAMLAEVVKWDGRGYSHREIAAKVGVSKAMIHHYLEEVKQRYLHTQLEARAVGVFSVVSQLRDVRREAWEAWERSKEDAVRKTSRKGPPRVPRDKDGKPLPNAPRSKELVLLELTEMLEGRLPANEYLRTILDTLKQERELLGLDEALKVDVKGAVMTIPWEELMGVHGPRPSDAIEAKLAAAALPPSKEAAGE